MGQVKNSTTGAAVQPVPLFSSSWVALYHYFRENYGKKREANPPAGNANADKQQRTRH